MRARWIAPFVLLVPLLSGAATPARQEVVGVIADPQGIPVLELLRQAQEIAGGVWFFEPRDLKDERVFLAGNVEVPRDRFLAFFEQSLADSFAHLELRGAAGTTHHLLKLGQQSRGQTFKTRAPLVTAEELAALAERHTLVTTIVETKAAPARETVTTLNLYFADSLTESIRNIEGTEQIVMTGFSDQVFRAVAMLRRIDADAADDPQVRAAHELAQAQRALEERVTALEKRLAADGGK